MKSVVAVVAMSLFAALVGAQEQALITVSRYDDADEFLPPAEKRNVDGVKLVLKQQAGEETLTAISERNVSIKVISKIPDGAKAGVVLFVGGSSVLSIGPDDKLDRSFNFTSRSREFYWPLGYATFLVDAPSDHLGKEGLTPQFRTTLDFAKDLKAVVALISKKFNMPLYAVGHSNGAVAVAALAAMPELPIRSYTLVSPAHTQWQGMELVGSTKYLRPVYIVENRKDECKYSSAGSIAGLANGISAPSVAVSWIEGGKNPIGGPCGPFGAHSFFGAEQLAVEAIVKNLK
jgi:hypothetical protein